MPKSCNILPKELIPTYLPKQFALTHFIAGITYGQAAFTVKQQVLKTLRQGYGSSDASESPHRDLTSRVQVVSTLDGSDSQVQQVGHSKANTMIDVVEKLSC